MKEALLSRPRPWWALLLVGALLAPLLTFAASDAAVPRLPPYIHGLGRQLGLNTNRQWIDSWAPSRHAKQLKRYDSPANPADPAWYVWAPACKNGRQVVRLRRGIDLHGPPADLTVTLHDQNQLALASVELWFNGRRVLRTAATNAPVQLADSAGRKLHRGSNDVEIVAVKKAGPCRGFEGLYVGLDGHFRADLRVAKGPPITYQRERESLQVIRFGNTGPSEVYQAKFEFQVARGWAPSGDRTHWEFELTVHFAEGAIVKDCDFERAEFTDWYRCDLENLAPGEFAHLTAQISFTPPYEPFADESTVLSWKVGLAENWVGPWESDWDNNSASAQLIICGTLSKRPECIALPP